MNNDDWFLTYTGKKFYPFDPDPDLVCIEDIAHSLAHLCRFNGHTREFYSVAQHSVYVLHIFVNLTKGTEFENSDKAHLCALLHDATEAYCGDMIRPIKMGMPAYQVMEEGIWVAVMARFDIDCVWDQVRDLVKQADNIALASERRDVLPKGPGRERDQWFIDEQGVVPDLQRIVPRRPLDAKQWFLDIYNGLIPREERLKAL